MRRAVFLLGVVLAGCGGDEADAPPPTPAPLAVTDRVVTPVDEVLAELEERAGFTAWLEAAFDAHLMRHPERAASLGLDDRFPGVWDWLDDRSSAFVAETDRLEDGLLAQARAFEPAALDPRERRLRAAFVGFLERRAALRPHREQVYVVSHLPVGEQVALERTLTEQHPFRTAAQAVGYLRRLRQVASRMTQIRGTLARRVEAGYPLPRRLVDDAIARTSLYVSAPPDLTSFYGAFAAGTRALTEAGVLPAAQRADLLQAGLAVIAEQVIPAYQLLGRDLQALQGSAPIAVGVGRNPSGEAFYSAALARHASTSTLGPDALHQLAEARLAEIQGQVQARFQDLGIDPALPAAEAWAAAEGAAGSFEGAAIARELERLVRAAEGRVGEAFAAGAGREVVVVPGATGGFYVPPALGSRGPGAFFAPNRGTLGALDMAAVVHREVYPGNHLQVARARAAGLPLFSLVGLFPAFQEGWALYAARLAAELDWHEGDAARELGRLRGEAFRAALLLVDTGIHARGWSFEEAAGRFAAATGFPEPTVDANVARVAAWPGQAAVYLTGLEELLRVRARARSALGAGFDLRAFHERVLEDGALPLDVLVATLEAWIASS